MRKTIIGALFALVLAALALVGIASASSAEEVEPPPGVESFSLVQNGCVIEASYSYVREGVEFSQAFVAFRVDGSTVKVLESLNGSTDSGSYTLTGNELTATINDLDSGVAYRTLAIDQSLCAPVDNTKGNRPEGVGNGKPDWAGNGKPSWAGKPGR